ncbi:MAG: hypothetical protein ACM37W_14830 [Actinomycetota bacterium]
MLEGVTPIVKDCKGVLQGELLPESYPLRCSMTGSRRQVRNGNTYRLLLTGMKPNYRVTLWYILRQFGSGLIGELIGKGFLCCLRSPILEARQKAQRKRVSAEKHSWLSLIVIH